MLRREKIVMTARYETKIENLHTKYIHIKIKEEFQRQSNDIDCFSFRSIHPKRTKNYEWAAFFRAKATHKDFFQAERATSDKRRQK